MLTEDIVLVIPKDHPLSKRTDISLHEIADLSFVMLKPGYSMRQKTDELCKQAGFTPNITFEVNDPSLILHIVKRGKAITLLPLNAWNRQKDSLTAALPIKDPIAQRVTGLSWLENRYLSAAAQHFQQFVIDYFADMEKENRKDRPKK